MPKPYDPITRRWFRNQRTGVVKPLPVGGTHGAIGDRVNQGWIPCDSPIPQEASASVVEPIAAVEPVIDGGDSGGGSAETLQVGPLLAPPPDTDSPRDVLLRDLKMIFPAEISPADLAARTGLPSNTVRAVLARLKDAGLVDNPGHGKYRAKAS